MAAEKGNKYAQKHNRDKVLEILNDAINGLTVPITKWVETKSGEPVEIDTFKYTSLERAMASNQVSRDKPYEWAKTWKDDEEVSSTIKDLMSLNKTTLMANTLDGSVAVAAGIFLMKAVHGMSDQPQAEEPKEEVTHDLSKLTPAELKKFIALTAKVQVDDE